MFTDMSWQKALWIQAKGVCAGERDEVVRIGAIRKRSFIQYFRERIVIFVGTKMIDYGK